MVLKSGMSYANSWGPESFAFKFSGDEDAKLIRRSFLGYVVNKTSWEFFNLEMTYFKTNLAANLLLFYNIWLILPKLLIQVRSPSLHFILKKLQKRKGCENQIQIVACNAGPKNGN